MIKRLRTNPLATAIVLASVATPLQSFGVALEEVVVTAQKRAQDMQDVPIAVTAMNADMIKKAGITGVEGIAARTPGFSMGEFNPPNLSCTFVVSAQTVMVQPVVNNL